MSDLPDSEGVSANGTFDSADGSLVSLNPVGALGLNFVATRKDNPQNTYTVSGTLIYKEPPTAQQTSSYQGADTGPSVVEPNCYIISVNGAMPQGALWHADQPMQNPQTIKGQGTWQSNGNPVVTNDAQGNYQIYKRLQTEIIHKIEALNPTTKFKRVHLPPIDGQNVTNYCYVLERTNTVDDPKDPNFEPIERAGVVVTLALNRTVPSEAAQSVVRGPNAPNAGIFVPSQGSYFNAAHLSVMIHPRSPHAPTCHSSFRYFEMMHHDGDPSKAVQEHWAYGGALNLMPTLLSQEHEDVCKNFHKTLRKMVEPHGENLHGSMKKWCDDYFHDQTHGERLGVGGIFYDNLGPNPNPKLDSESAQRPSTKDECRNFVNDMTTGWSDAFMKNLKALAWTPWTAEDRDFQLRRRGRMCDYFLAQDIGFRFGLATNSGSLPAMRLVLPELAKWSHDPVTNLSDGAANLLNVLQNKPRDWADE